MAESIKRVPALLVPPPLQARIGGLLPEPRAKPRPPALDRRIGAAEGFREIVMRALGALLANQKLAAAGDAEGVHQMRIAVRQLRSALVLFAPRLEPHGAAWFTDESRRLGRVLGEPRDWDVFCLHTLPTVEFSERVALRQAAEAERAAAHRALEEELTGATVVGLTLEATAWADRRAGLEGDLADLAPGLLDRLAREVRRRGRHLRRRSDADLHALRKSLKKLRYSVDDLAGLFPEKAVRAYGKRCKRLQRLLGDYNDAAVAAALARRLGGDVGALVQWSERRRDEIRPQLPEAWNAFKGARAFWVS